MGQHRESEVQAIEDLGQGVVDPAEVARAAEETARSYPHGSLAGAFALGFLLGGGLTPRLLASLVVFVGRRYAAEATREAFGVAMRNASSCGDGEAVSSSGVEERTARP